jgi:adenine-specific DNA-methyltransferase
LARYSHARVILDEIFGSACFVNEIVWKRQTAKGDVTQGAKHMGRIHESILVYTKSQDYTWHMQYMPYDEKYIESHYNNIETGTGRRFRWDNLTAPGGAAKGNPSYEFLGVRRFWRYTRENMEELYRARRIALPKPGGVPAYKRYLDEMPGVPVQDIWTDVNPINSQAIEAVGYATQKPEVLLDRILRISSNEDDLVLDCFCGSGTTAAVAEKLKRRWIACDLGRFAIHTTRKRLLSIPGVRPFAVQNLGKYERQLWVGAEFGENQAAVRQRAYIEFVLKLAQATPLNGYTWLHGVKTGRMVHVGAVDAPVSGGDVTQIAVEFRRAVGTGKDAPQTNGVDVLGWDFAFEMNEVAKQQAAAANIQMRFLRIPRDVMDKRAVEQRDIHFFELAALSVEVKASKRNVHLKLNDFVIPPDDVPEEARRTVRHWSQWIDYWAVDWDNKSDTFHNEWQTYRTRKDKSLVLETAHTYADPGEYTVVVKVIDILGNDTTKTVKVSVA